MLRIGQVESTATSDSKYTDGSVAGGVAATRLRAAAFNAIQEELAYIVESAGMTLDTNDTTQVLTALNNQMPGRLLNVQKFIDSGTYTPTAGTKKIRVRICGGGGAGGGAAASTTSGYVAAGHGGSAGTYGETSLIDATSISSVAVTVGSGGVGSAGANGSAGGNSSFGSYITAPGGAGGARGLSTSTTQTAVSDLGATGSCSGSDVLVNVPGQGGRGQFSLNSSTAKGGAGGSSVLGRGGSALTTNATAGDGSGYGAGGAGSVTTASGGSSATAGGNGSYGIVLIEEYA